ncbi:MAG: coproporphyrinogen III oxidase family protein [Synergistales bacterium]|nr:coproporphyrinogen III oxidase family protein [Synergistales bacterium]
MGSPPRELGVYLHVPFCLAKCPYCPFPSRPLRRREADAYLQALREELDLWKGRWGVLPPVSTLYVGGGTPTVLDAPQWSELIALLEERLPLQDGAEVSVEANPGTLTAEQLALWRAWRVTRVSIGVQSLDDGELAWLQRPYSAGQAVDALHAALGSGFRVSADLLFGLGGQTLQGWHRTLREVTAAGVGHISAYQLTLHPGTPWGDHPPGGLPEGYPFYRFCQWYLPRHGMPQYEVASFARIGEACRHNLAYWRRTPVLGLGPAAWGFLGGLRYRNHWPPEDWRETLARGELPQAYTERLEGRAAAREAAILALRTAEGIDRAAFAERYGAARLDAVGALLAPCAGAFLSMDADRIALTPRGFRVANAIWELLVD